MIDRMIRYYQGYLYVRIRSNNPERFFNLCAHNQIYLWNMKHEGAYYYFFVGIKDFFKLKQFHLKTKTRIKIIKRHGLPFFFQRNRKRKAFFLGFLLFLFLIYTLSIYIWNIHIEGNTYYSTQKIIDYLETQDIHHGIRKKRLDCAAIAAGLRQEFSYITWVSAKIQGTQLILEIKENDTVSSENEKPENEIAPDTPCDIVAPKDGKIIKIITRAGKPLLKEGAECKKGDILVSGSIDIMSDSLEVVRTEYVHADADIYLETTYAYYDEFSMNYKERIYPDKKKTSRFLRIFNFHMDFGRKKYKYEHYDQFRQEKNVHLTENFVLPISYGTITTLPYQINKKKYTKAQAEKKANDNIFAFIKNLSQKGVEIQKKSVKIDTTDSVCKAVGRIHVIEKINTKAPIQPVTPTPVPGAPEVVPAPEVTPVPEAPETTQAPVPPEATPVPGATQAPPEATPVPGATQVPAPPEATTVPEATQAPAPPEATPVPEASQVPTPTEATPVPATQTPVPP